MQHLALVRRGLVSLLFCFSIVLSNLLPYLSQPARAAGLAIDGTVKTHQSAASKTLTSGAFSTTQAGDLVIAFITADGPNSSKGTSFSSVTTTGLTWKMRQRVNIQSGDTEIWQAVAPNTLTNATVKATRAAGSYGGSIVVVAFSGADTSTDGASAGANSSRGAPAVSLTATRTGSWVWGAGNDYDNAIARTVGANQTKYDEWLASTGDTYWTQSRSTADSTAGSTVTLNDTAPTGDRYNMAAVEILPVQAADTQAPSTPANLAGTAASQTQVNLSWSASTDNVGVVGYKVMRDGTQIATSINTSYTDNTAAASTTYNYTVRAYDAAGNTSADSNVATVTTPAPPNPPVISNVASNPTDTTATITWNTDTPSTSQVLYGADASYGSSTTKDNNLVTSHSQTLTGLSASTTYHFEVQSVDSFGGTSTSGDNTFTTSAPAPDTQPPSAPTNLTATASSSSVVDLSWGASTDNVGVSGYQVFRNGAQVATVSSTSYSDTGLSASTAYSYYVVATDAAGNVSTQSNTAQATTQASGPQLIFDDEFDGTSVNTSLWDVMNQHGDTSAGAGQNEGCYLTANTTVANGILTEASNYVPSGFTCPPGTPAGNCGQACQGTQYFSSGAIQQASANFTYGTVQVRAKFPGAAGSTWPAIWLLGASCQTPNWLTSGPNSTGYDCPWSSDAADAAEIDIAEGNTGSTTDMLENAYSSSAGLSSTCHHAMTDYSADFHIYELDWAPGSLVFKVDGVATSCGITGSQVPSHPMFLIINSAMQGSAPNPSDFPQSLQVDYVRIYQ